MSQAGMTGGATSGFVSSLTPDTGGAVTPTLGTIPVLGYPAGSSQVIETYNDGNELKIADQTFITRYVVDPSTTDGLKGTYQTIGAAITQAVADGWTVGSGVGTIYIRSGTYIEDIVIPTGLAVQLVGPSPAGLSSSAFDVIIQGSITHETGSYCVVQNVYVGSPSTDTVILDGGVSLASYDQCFISEGTNSAILFSGSTSGFIALQCVVFGKIVMEATSTSAGIANSAKFYDCEILSSGIFEGAGDATFYNCRFPGASLSDTSAVALYNCVIANAVSGTSTATIYAYDCQCVNNGPITFFDTDGSLRYSNCTVTNGSNLYSLTQPRLFQPNAQGNIINSTTTAVSYNVLYSDYYVGVTDTSAPRTITLPDPATISIDQSFIIKDQSGGAAANNITINTAAGTIDGAASKLINTNYGSYSVKSNGTNYFVM